MGIEMEIPYVERVIEESNVCFEVGLCLLIGRANIASDH